MKLFKDLNLNSNIAQALEQLGFTQPTEIQGKAIPILLDEKTTDFHGQAQTGTGKTLAFGIPLIQNIDKTKNYVQALIVAPTRELVTQICDSLKPIAKSNNVSICSIYGGVSMVRQIEDLKKGIQIVVGTPGRLNDHLRRKSLQLNKLQTLVLDEADKMLDMGFKEEVDEILTFAPQNRKIWLFSATVKRGINDIKKNFMHNVITVSTSIKNISSQNTKQFFCVVPMNSRIEALCRIIDSQPDFYGFIFCPTKILTDTIAQKLSSNGYEANCLHGDMDQPLRTRVIEKFKQKKFKILVATDVAARGIDVSDVTHVINYTIPNDYESYIHRIGRTGRAGKAGTAITFINNSEIRHIKAISSKFNLEINLKKVPSYKEVLESRISKIKNYISSNENYSSKDQNIQELDSILSNYQFSNLKNVLVSLLSEKFLSNLENKEDIGINETHKKQSFSNNASKVELEMNVGSDDGINSKDIRHYLADKGGVSVNCLERIKVLRRKTFIILPSKQINGLIPKLKNYKLHGREVRLAINNL